MLLLSSDTIDCPGGNTHYSCCVQYSCSGLKIEMSSYASKAKAAKSFAGKTYFLCTYTDAFHLHTVQSRFSNIKYSDNLWFCHYFSKTIFLNLYGCETVRCKLKNSLKMHFNNNTNPFKLKCTVQTKMYQFCFLFSFEAILY